MAPTEYQRSTRLTDPSLQPKKARIARYLAATGPQIVERKAKGILLMKGTSCSQRMGDVLKDLRSMKAPYAKLLTKKNAIYPFEDTAPIDFLTTKNDSSMFAIASSNKKRPNNLVIGRTFDHQVLDMIELGITRYVGLHDDKYKGTIKKRIGSKPLMVFVGDYFHNNGADGKRLQSLLLDFYGGFERSVASISLAGLDHVISVTAGGIATPSVNGTGTASVVFHVRTYHVKLKKNPSAGKAPLPFLTPCGPDMDIVLRRTSYASPDIWREAMKSSTSNSKSVKKNKKNIEKNKTINEMGEVVGRLHIEKQDISKIQGKKAKALRVADAISKKEEKDAIEADLKKEKEKEDAEDFL
mmetsp:Transcript_26381/g.60785  ORF Transcript_26381/g.60785 Transcript_26381/m.60785 type:complete len:355 (-) Transcript_26381:392-1456(-)